MSDTEATDEIGWVVRRARELVHGHATAEEWVEYFDRKAAMLERLALGQPDLAASARRQADQWRAAAGRTTPSPDVP